MRISDRKIADPLPFKRKIQETIDVDLRGYNPPSGLGKAYDEKTYKQLYQRTWNQPWPEDFRKIQEATKKAAESLSKAGLKDLEILSKTFKTKKMEKKLIGYKLKKESVENNSNIIEVAQKITRFALDYSNPDNVNPDGRFSSRHSYNELKKAGVLDLWFEPVYEETYKNGDWVWVSNDSRKPIEGISMPAFVRYNKCGGITQGFNFVGQWVDEFYLNEYFIFRKAESKEVGEKLRNKAMNDYKLGNKVDSLTASRYSEVTGFHYDGDTLYGASQRHGGPVLYKDGKWATIVEKLKLPSFHGYDAKDTGDYLEWGCYAADKDVLRQMDEMGITSFTLVHQGRKIEVSESYTKQIFDYLKFQ